ncbi:hypothetical protein EV646_110372 [Kribbella antiqua]|uniref:Uncharacterized protein n=1 Tax=Kribbella antiqua TaxID=2512217 RepID=A0A4R2IJC2_9ACTN|nr:hypothetical protein [Kribbella antiqua]TCO44657.1 hypothetical protein EV646_110372 [Kribbella antiqua]
MIDPDELAAAQRRKLELLDAVLAAIERRSEVLDIVSEAESPEAALLPVQNLLGITEENAWAVIDLQFRRLTKSNVARIEWERDELRAQWGDDV